MKKTIYTQDSAILTDTLRHSRKLAGLTIRGLAEKMEVHHSIIGKIETGERRLDVIEFMEYCKALGVSPLEILKEIQKKQN